MKVAEDPDVKVAKRHKNISDSFLVGVKGGCYE